MEATLRSVIAVPLIAVAITACGPRNQDQRNYGGAAPILLFTGSGASPGDVAAIETVLDANHLAYATVRSPELNGMTVEDLRRHRLLIVPGGDFVRIGNSLAPAGLVRVHDAVYQGLNYLGVCAGAFLAGHFPRPYKGLNLTSGVQFRFYDAVRRVHKTPVAITTAGGSTLDQYWEDGPQLTGWGAVVAKYPDGTPAIVQGMSGEGWLVLTGVHPEAPESWRRGMMFNTPSSTDNAFAATLIQSALHRTPLAQF
jgi:glutamine amidotransferase-like uncharacterized protein